MDLPSVAQEVLYHTITSTVYLTDLVARAESTASTTTGTASSSSGTHSATSTSTSSTATRPGSYKIVGICLAVCSGLFIGVSFVLKKVGLLKANVKYNEEAGEGYGYLKNAYWWTGMTLMIIGEICNFVAYAFTDAILVTPLGALSVVITTILSAIFLKERLSFVGKLGCAICIVGSVIIPLNAPTQSAVADIQQMQHYVITPGFLSYAGVIILGCAFIAWWVAPRYGKKSMMVYLSICSLIGGLSVVSTQGLGSAIVAQINGKAQFNKWFTYVLLVFVICTLLTEIIYLNVSRRMSGGEPAHTDCATESPQPLQRRPCNAHLLRLLHLFHHRRLRRPLPRLRKRHSYSNRRRDPRLPRHLRRRRSTPTREIVQRRARYPSLQGRSRSGAHCGGARRARVRAESRYHSWRSGYCACDEQSADEAASGGGEEDTR